MPTLVAEVGFTAGPDTGDYGLFGDEVRGLFDTATFAPDALWSDITAYVHRATLRRGSSRVDSPILRYEPGTSQVVLNNSDRRFDPTNLSGPYVSAGLTQVTPMRAVRYRASWAGVIYALWAGNADSWQLDYTLPRYSSVIMTATDGFKVLAAQSRQAGGSVGAGEASGARITRILNSAGWPATARLVAGGDTTVQATTLDGEVLAELQLVADTELGDLYMGGAGHVVFRNRRAAITELRSVAPVARFGDGDPSGTTQTTVNLLRHPSSETVLGWVGGGFANAPTLTQDATHALVGSTAALVTWATASAGDLPQAAMYYGLPALRSGGLYTFSVSVWVPTGSPPVTIFANGTWGDQLSSVFDAWQRLTWTGLALASPYFQVWPKDSTTTAGQQVWLDAAQLEDGATATTYCDGDQAGCGWDGTAHGSVSRRLPELAYAGLTWDYDDAQLANLVRITRVGGAVQSAQDAASRAQYLTHTFDRDDLIMQADGDAANLAGWIAYQSKDPELRPATLTLRPQRDPARLWPQALGRDIGDRITVVLRPPGGGTISRDAFIRGITHDIERREWVTTFVLQSATKWAFGIFDNNYFGRFDECAFAF
jgi:hypothetical protein